MAWYETLTLILGAVLGLLAIGMPVAFSLIAVTLAGVLLTQGWGGPFQQYILSIKASVSPFNLLPVPLFVLMGEILWHSTSEEKALKIGAASCREGVCKDV